MNQKMRTYYLSNAETKLEKQVGEVIRKFEGLELRSAPVRIALGALEQLYASAASKRVLAAGERFVVACAAAEPKPPAGVIYKGDLAKPFKPSK